MMSDDASTYLQGEAETLRDAIEEFERDGYLGQFAAREGGVVRCFSCRHDFAPVATTVDTIRRLEGASDPDDMLAVVPLTCPHCATRGTLVLAYGPEAALEDSEVLAALPQPSQPPTPDTGSPIPDSTAPGSGIRPATPRPKERHMTLDPSEKRDAGDAVGDVLSGFNAEEIVDDPDELDDDPKPAPAATPDSPNPI